MPDLTWFMWGNMVIEATSNPLTLTLPLPLTLTLTPHPDQVIEATKPSVDRCWYELIGSCGFFGKGLLDCEKYIVKVIGTPEKLIEALPVDIMSHDTPEGFLLRPCFADHVTMEEEPARNFITFESQVRLRVKGEGARAKGKG